MTIPQTTTGQAADTHTVKIGPETLQSEDPLWLLEARELPDWDTKGAPHEKSLLIWKKRKDYSDEAMEASVVGLATVQDKTYQGYRNLASALQRRVSMGWDRAPDAQTPSSYESNTLIPEELRKSWESR